uniref:Uncharacterized protein n=1 Tax=Rhizophora mucronata TaxID=61149 RepID=A0A2P2PLR1_RHIMU
MKSQLLSS